MYQTYVMIQYIGILLLFIEIGVILYQKVNDSQILIFIFATAVLINTIGYLLELKADNMNLAVYAVKIIYLGKPFICLSAFLFVLNYCRVRYPKILGIVLFFIHAGISILVLTCEYQSLFYSSIRYSYDGVFPHLILGHGIIYNIYMALVIIYSVIMLCCCIYRYQRSKENIERKNLLGLMLITLFPFVGIIIFFSGLTGGYDVTAPSYIISASILLYCFVRYHFLETLQLAKDNVLDNLTKGVIVLDNSDDLLYVNDVARTIFPQISSKTIAQILQQLYALMEMGQHIEHQEQIYAVSVENVYYRKSKRGKMFLLEDITESLNDTNRLEHAVAEKTREVQHIQHAVINGFANIVETRDDVTGMHIKNTSTYVQELCHALVKRGYHTQLLTTDYIDQITHAAPLHDIGKIAIPDAILCKPGQLDAEEFAVIQTHAETGAQMIMDILKDAGNDPTLLMAREMAYYHHEHWDGNGYPCGLKGEEIPVCARIMAIADVYDALVSRRSYKEAFSVAKAITIISESAGTQFEPEIAEAFIDMIRA